MSLGRPRDVRKEQQWRRAILGYQKSGLSVRAYCARHNLSEASFYLWRRKLQDRGPVVAFVPVEVAEAPAGKRSSGVEVLLQGERRIQLAPGFDVTTLQRVVAALEEARSC